MNLLRQRIFVALALVLLSPQLLFGWSEGGHNVIGFLAFKRLPADKQERFLAIMKQHPNFEKDFNVPKNVSEAGDDPLWIAGRACYWPDVARSYKEYHRSTWHYQLGPSLVIGDRSKLKIPDTPGPLPAGATLETQELHIEQAIELCRNVMKSNAKDSDKAIALCWLGHLVGDYHQPCHTGSLYCEQFAGKDGDRGANSIETKQSKNLHALWDGLLGQRYDHSDVKRRVFELEQIQQRSSSGAVDDPVSAWAQEGKVKLTVYTPEVLKWVEGDRTEPLELSENYLKAAGAFSKLRAKKAAERLAVIWAESI